MGSLSGFISLRNATIVVDDPATLVTSGTLLSAGPIMAILGFALIVALAARGLSAAVLLGMLAMTVLGWLTGGRVQGRTGPALDPTPLLFALDIQGPFSVHADHHPHPLLLVDVFDTAGTLVAVAERSGIVRPDGSLPRLRAALSPILLATALGAPSLAPRPPPALSRAGRGLPPGSGQGSQPLQACSFWLAHSSSRPRPRACPPLPRPRRFFVACLMARGLADLPWDDLTEAAWRW